MKPYVSTLSDYQHKIIRRLYDGESLDTTAYSWSTIRSLKTHGWIIVDPLALTPDGRAAYGHWLNSPSRRYRKAKSIGIPIERLEQIQRAAKAQLEKSA